MSEKRESPAVAGSTMRRKAARKKGLTTKKKTNLRKAGSGRPTRFRKEFTDLVYDLALSGMTNEQMAKCFGVSTTTLDNWRKRYPAFLVAMKRGKLEADAEVAHSLYRRAVGMTTEELREIKGKDGEVVTTKIKKEIPGDVTAIRYWLSNRQPDRWRDKVNARKEESGTFQIRINEYLQEDSTEAK